MSDAEKWTPPAFGSPVWIEIPAADVPACKEFYEKVFPSWTWRPSTEEHPTAKIALFSFNEGGSLGGGIVNVPAECKASELNKGVGVTIYHLVKNIEETKKLIEELGGIALTEKEPEGKHGWHMNFKDVAGNRFAIYEFDK